MFFQPTLRQKLVYVFRINDAAHRGCLKIGETTLPDVPAGELAPNSHALNVAARARIDQYTRTAAIAYELLHTECAQGTPHPFSDHAVHDVLLRSGVEKKTFDRRSGANEWFVTDLPTVCRAIAAVKEGRRSLLPGEVTTGRSPIVFRPEQREAIDKTVGHLRRHPLMLWDAKMRFGKTLAALEVVKEAGFRRTLIMTHRPAVDEGWYADFGKIFTPSHPCAYGSHDRGERLPQLEASGKPYIYFASLQDLRGAEEVGGRFDKHQLTYRIAWDLIIVDEAHEGYLTPLGQAVDQALTRPHTKKLLLSGTSFNLFALVAEPDDVFSWTYIDEQRAKRDWDLTHYGDPNPYAALPTMNILTYDLGRLLHEFIDEDVAFNFREFFRVVAEPGDRVGDDTPRFVHEADVRQFLDLLCSGGLTSNYPFANDHFRTLFRHTLWMVPGVKAALALQRMLEQHPVFQAFTVVNVAGDGDPLDPLDTRALRALRQKIGPDPLLSRTITLSCGRLTTGVTVPEWTAVMMLRGSYATGAMEYMQTIFRVQSPWEREGMMKTDAYVFDFAPDRTLKVLAEAAKVSHKAGTTTDGDRQALGDFLNFCPVISLRGSEMNRLDVDHMLQTLKRVYIERVVNNGFEDGYLYTDKLQHLTREQLTAFSQLKEIIGQTAAMPRTDAVDINHQGLTDEQHEEKQRLERKPRRQRTPEEEARLRALKEQEKTRQTAISILRGISIRMPLLIYGVELKEGQEITLRNFADLIDDRSWKEFMPQGVTRQLFASFLQYYDPDVFAAAAMRIRAMARAADALTIEDRIARITQIFRTFRNPDKETVLTPWRVVNLHLSDTLGGYCFFDPDFPDEPLAEPRLVERTGITPQVFRTDARILELNSKTGLYPLYMAYSVYRAHLASMLTAPESIKEEWEVWEKTVRENIFVVCKTRMAEYITRRTLVGFHKKMRVNTKYFKDLVDQIRSNPNDFIEKVTQGKSHWKATKKDNMKYNAIVGNPPYQIMDGGAGASAKPVYNLFVDVARLIAPKHLSMIMPAKWFTDGKGLDVFRASMLADRHIAAIFDYPDSHDIFPTVDVAGGICYIHWAKDYDGPCRFTTVEHGHATLAVRDLNASDTFIRRSEAIDIVDKVKAKAKGFYNSRVSSRKPFGLATDVKPLASGDIELKTRDGFGPFDASLISVGREKIGQWKVLCSCLTAEHAGQTDRAGRKRIISSLDLLRPQQICTETYLVIDSFDTEEEARALYKYVQTRFFRFLVSLKASTQHMSKEKFALVPLQDFSSASSLDWRQDVSSLDACLCRLYGLTSAEEEFIVSMIKPM